MGPLFEFRDPAFLSWANLRTIFSIGLGAGLLGGLWDAAFHGWGGVSELRMVFTAVWIPLVFVGLHLYLRRAAAEGNED